jgi:condensin complex subunit 2
MKSCNRPPPAPNNPRRKSTNPFAAVLLDDDDDDIAVAQKYEFSTNVGSDENLIPLFPLAVPHNSYEKNEDDDDDDESSQTSQSSATRRVRPPRPSMAVVTSTKNLLQQRRRRRSSARFLQLSNTTKNMEDDDNEDDDEVGHGMMATSHNRTYSTLQEMYQTVIRMNAENKINTTNTWNLHIIDQMGTLLSLNDGKTNTRTENISQGNDKEFHPETNTDSNGSSTSNKNENTRVNFTKASCTLDASVKIYSYRVDDVHLTSYKVLANLNRTQNNKNEDKQSKQIEENIDRSNNDDKGEGKSQSKEQTRSTSGSTLETNIGKCHYDFCV